MKMNISPKDKKTLQFGMIAGVCVIVVFAALKGMGAWQEANEKYNTLQGKIDTLAQSNDPVKVRDLLSKVPDFNMPVVKDTQRFRFRDSIDAQINGVGINAGPLQEQTSGKVIASGYELLRWKSNGTCTFKQLLDLLADLKENPYLVGVEELRIKITTPSAQQRNNGPAARGGSGLGSITSRGGSSSGSGAAAGRGGPSSAGQSGPRGGQTTRQVDYELTVSTLAKVKAKEVK
jgi:hypothetical protein